MTESTFLGEISTCSVNIALPHIKALYTSLQTNTLCFSDLHSSSLLEAASQLVLGSHRLVLGVCLLVGVNDAAVSMSVLDALAAAVVGEGVAGVCVLHLPITVHRRHLMDLDRGFWGMLHMDIYQTYRKVTI